MPKGRPFDTHQPYGNAGGLEEVNRRAIAEAADERFLTALQRARQEELRTALLIEVEIHKVPNREELTAFERAMERVKQGAPISNVIPMPRSIHTYSLTGCSGALL